MERVKHRRQKRGEPINGGEIIAPWETVGNVIKYFRFSYDYILWEISWANVNMLLASIPDYSIDAEEENENISDTQMDNLQKVFGKMTF